MPDLVTHLSAGYILRRAFSQPVLQVLFLVGTVLPDVYAKLFKIGFAAESWFVYPTHSPLMILFECLLPCYLLEVRIRKPAFFALYLGAILHLVLDTCKDQLGSGVVMWAFPFRMRGFEWGLYLPEDTIYLAPVALVIAVVVELMFKFVARRRREA